MATLPFSLPLPLDPVPVQTLPDVNQYLPNNITQNDPAPTRDAAFTAFLNAILKYQALTSYASGQSDPIKATDIYLEGLALDRGVNKQINESDNSLRGRIFLPLATVTPITILSVVNAILANLTTIKAEYLESVRDRWFVFDGTQPANEHSFVGPVSPQYLERFYRDDSVLNGGTVVSGREPGGNWLFGDEVGRYFVIRIPVLVSSNDTHAFTYISFVDPSSSPSVNQAGLNGANAIGSFIANGSNSGGSEADGSDATFLYQDTSSDLVAYQSIADAVYRIKGHSVRFMLYVDPNLVN
jgi:hypothetical protein